MLFILIFIFDEYVYVYTMRTQWIFLYYVYDTKPFSSVRDLVASL